jgi:hypothetical protein
MIVQGTDASTGAPFSFETDKTVADFSHLSRLELTKEQLSRRIDNLAISADAKDMLNRLSNIAVDVGGALIRLGRKILEVVLEVYSKFPAATFGIVFGLIAGALVGDIKLIGHLAGKTITAILVIFFGAQGFQLDVKNQELKNQAELARAQFSAFGA